MGSGVTLKNRNEKSKFYEYIAPSSYKKQQHDLALKQEEAESDLENATENKKEYFQKRVDEIKQKRKNLKDQLFASYENASDEQIQYDLEKLQEQFDNVDIITGGDKYSRAAKNDAEKALKKAAQDRESLFAATDLNVKGIDALNYKVTDAVAQQIKKRRDNLWFKAKDLEYEFIDTKEQYEKAIEKYGVDGAFADGFFETTVDGKKKIFVNTSIAAQARAANVIGHELLHYAISNRFANDPEAMKKSIISFKDYIASIKGGDYILKSLEKRFIDGGYAKDGKISYDDDGLVIMEKPDNIEEYFNAFSDLIDGELIEAVEERSEGIKNNFRTMARGLGIGAKKVDFNNGQEIFDLLIDYNKNINAKGLLAARRQRKAVEAVAGKEIKPVDKASRKKSRSKAVDAANKVEQEIKQAILAKDQKFTKENLQRDDRSFTKILNLLKPNGAISNYIKSLGMSSDKTQETIDAVTDRLINYNPQAQRKTDTGEAITLGEFLMANVGFGKKVAAKELFVKSERKTQEVEGDAPVEGGQTFLEKAVETVADKEVEVELSQEQQYSKFRQDLGLNKEMMAKVRNAVVKTFGTKLPEVSSKKFRSALEKAYRTELKKPIQDMMGGRDDYNEFLGKDFKTVYEKLPVETLVQMERLVESEKLLEKYPNAKKIFKTA